MERNAVRRGSSSVVVVGLLVHSIDREQRLTLLLLMKQQSSILAGVEGYSVIFVSWAVVMFCGQT